ncbi:peptidase [Anaerobacillus sp. 1_MG-2023]|uniref:peptidase n=1 Tax=Anaerobacillus sp. 1_MG-2023 TaxID=3062655 RepID=UPI0026E2392E|nr:peptidase [Anaerobacillus sp. 1_MG-2023]MDO6655768.1 peptidase [Anaerobacillus sp. 1_MG-2023]
MKEEIYKWMMHHRDYGVEMLQRFVRCDSVQGNEANVQDLVQSELHQLGMKIDRFTPGDETLNHRAFCANRTDFTQSPNVVGVWKGKGGGRSLILNGHIDVVPPGNRSDWELEPYSGEVKNGRLYGRGATDMKGGNTAMLLALKCLKDLELPLNGDLIFESVVEEESGGTGTLAAIERGYRADAALIPEPTKMKVFPKQQGSMWFRITVSGRGAHGGTRYEGVSALEKSVSVIKAIQLLEEQRNNRITDSLYENIPIPVPINIGKISGGDWPSSVPDQVVLEGRMGVIPGEELDDAKLDMRRALEAIEDDWLKDHPVEIEWFGARWLPGEVDEDHPLVGVIRRHYEEVTGKALVIEASPWGTDGGLLQEEGNTPSIIFGPGETAVAHFANEYIEIDQMMLAAELFVHIILEWCGQYK